MFRSVCVIAAHPDDEVLGCGATMAKYAAAGDHVHVLILAEGATSRTSSRDPLAHCAELTALQAAGIRAAEILGVRSIDFAGLPDNRLDGQEFLDIVKCVEGFLSQKSPDVVITHSRGDMNLDHTVVQRAVATAIRPTPGSKLSTFLQFEVPSSTEWGVVVSNEVFVPNWFEDIENFIEAKIAALEAYQTEMRDYPHPRSVEYVKALAQLRGATVGVHWAEAFVSGWQINRSR